MPMRAGSPGLWVPDSETVASTANAERGNGVTDLVKDLDYRQAKFNAMDSAVAGECRARPKSVTSVDTREHCRPVPEIPPEAENILFRRRPKQSATNIDA